MAKIVNEESIWFKVGRKQYLGLVAECKTIWDVCIRHRKDFIVNGVSIKKSEASNAQEALNIVVERIKDEL